MPPDPRVHGVPHNSYNLPPLRKKSLRTQMLSSSLSIGVKDVAGVSETLSEEREGEVLIHEELHTAWVPTPWTQQLLAQTQPTKDPSHLTCPALVAGVRVVRRSTCISLIPGHSQLFIVAR